jgi:hypothetical protein
MKTRTEITLEMDRTLVIKRRRKALSSAADTSDLRELAGVLRSEQADEPATLEFTPCQPRPVYPDQSKRS